MPTAFVGIDVCAAHLDVRALPAERSFRVPNDPQGHRKLVETLLPLAALPAEIRAVLESTGGLELQAALALEAAGLQVAIIKPERARHFAKAHGQLAKTDAIDARVLARFAKDVPLAITPLPPQDLRDFRDLLDRRHQLVEIQTMEKNRLSSTRLDAARKSLADHIDWIEDQIGELETELDRRVAENPKWKEIDRILRSIPSIGAQTSRTLIGHLPELGCVDRKAIGQLVGVAPVANDSGSSAGQRRIVGGRWQVRCGLDMAAVSAIKCNPPCRALYLRLKARGKAGKVAVIAVIHKLLTIANAMVAQKTEWRHSNVAEKT